MVHVVRRKTSWRSVMEQRLQCVLNTLDQLQDSKSGPKELHDARVACRRAEAALRVCRDLLSTKRTLRLRQDIRKIRRATNEIRDQDVLRKWFTKQKGSESAGLCRIVEQRRDKLFARMIKSMGNLRRLRDSVAHVTRPARGSTSIGWQSCLGRRLLQEVYRFLECIPEVDSDTERLHELRIAGKRLRYACELATEVLPESNFRPLLRRLKQMQVHLGKIHDTAARIDQLMRLSASGRALWIRASRLDKQQLTQDWSARWRATPWESALGSAVTVIVGLIRESR